MDNDQKSGYWIGNTKYMYFIFTFNEDFGLPILALSWGMGTY